VAEIEASTTQNSVMHSGVVRIQI